MKLLMLFCSLLLFSQSLCGQLNRDRPYLYSMGGCGFMGDSGMPDSAIEMIELVNSRNYAELKKWLQSPYPEIQAFGVKGMHYLCQMGVSIEEEDIETIDCLVESTTLVNTCAGCVYSEEPMRDLLQYKNLVSSFWYYKNEGFFNQKIKK